MCVFSDDLSVYSASVTLLIFVKWVFFVLRAHIHDHNIKACIYNCADFICACNCTDIIYCTYSCTDEILYTTYINDACSFSWADIILTINACMDIICMLIEAL